MTEKLFYQDSSIKEFTATVESWMQGKDGMFEVILDQTAFFPEGGGQYADTGVLRSLIFHTCADNRAFGHHKRNCLLLHV